MLLQKGLIRAGGSMQDAERDLSKTAPKPAKGQPKTSDATYKSQCKQQYESLRDQVMQFLISASWINQEAAESYFGGNAVGGAVIDREGRRTQIIGVVRAAPLGALQRRAEPAIYFPMAQDYLPRMTLVLAAPAASEETIDMMRGRLDRVLGGAAPVTVMTLEAHLGRTALAPLRIATVLVSASAAMALVLGVIGLYGALTDAARQRRRELAVRIALGARAWRVIGLVLRDAGRLAAAGVVAGMLGALVVAGPLARLAPNPAPVAGWVWLAGPVVLVVTVAIASVLPAWRALRVPPITIMRDDG